MGETDLQPLCTLLRQQRWAALATVRNGEPYCSMIAYATTDDLSSLILHLSTLAPHTQRLLKMPQISIAISETEQSSKDPQTLARVTLNGHIQAIEKSDPCYATLKQRYLKQLPDADMLFSFADFKLYRFIADKIRYVGGFANAHSIKPQQLIEAANRA
ncbi:MAG: CREG family protein [Gammaproteobacteria bacterium]|nr:CREG family protein [Gammaproteobacteria bacterium]MCF6231060.1 CREG family protein [Gammaproteobacteria bacterium]